MSQIEQRLRAKLEAREQSQRLRALPSALDGVDFCSNDYLGLAQQLWEGSSAQHGSTGSRLISGNSASHEGFEAQLAMTQGFGAALLFGSGFSANLGLLACLAERGDTLLLDELAHASLIDGARLSHGQRRKFAHNDLQYLEQQLQQPQRGQVFVVVESVYSMDGDSAPLEAISALCVQYGAALIVDEAHALGVVGERGEGWVAKLGLQDRVFACVYTFGKALGCHGAAVAGGNTLKQYLVNFCRPFIYSTAPSPQQIQTMRQAFERSREMWRERQYLYGLIAQFRSVAQTLSGVELLPSDSAIQSLVVPGEAAVKSLAEALQMRGLSVKAIVSPTVPEGRERLRVCLHSHNTRDQINQLHCALQEVL